MSEPRVALVIGGAQRVGRAIVESLRAHHFDVFFTYRSDRPGDPFFSSPRALRLDLASPDCAARLLENFRTRSDRLDLLVHCASRYEPDPTDARAMFRINHDAPVEITRALAPHLQNAGGCVVNMLDILAERPLTGYATYCASKAALWNATLSLARELAPRARVNGIAPGVVDWPPDMPDDAKNAYLARVPLARAGTPDDVARLARFLALDAPYITGQVIRLDGGRSLV